MENQKNSAISEVSFQQEILTVQQELRLLPKKRCTALMYSKKSGNLIGKIFLGCGAKRRYLRELTGIELLQKHQLPTLPIMMHGPCEFPQDAYLIAFPYLEKAETLNDCSDKVFEALVREFSAMHRAGVYQKDCHRNNFLWYENKLILIDGDEISERNPSKYLALKNCARLISQFTLEKQEHLKSLFSVHYDAYGFDGNSLENAILEANIEKAKFIKKKSLRDSSLAHVVKQNRKTIYMNRSKNIDVSEIEKAITLPEDGFLKKGNSATVWRYKNWVVKRFNVKDASKRIARMFKKSRAQNAWEFSFVLKSFGIETPATIAWVECFYLGFPDVFFLITEHQKGVLLSEKIKQSPEKWLNVGVQFLDSLATLGISHGDMKATNFIVDEQNAIWIIDLDTMSFSNAQKQRKDLARFQRNFGDH